MKALSSVAAMVLVLSMTVAQSAGSARTGEQTPRAAVWSPHALIVDLRNLPSVAHVPSAAGGVVSSGGKQ